MPRGLHYLHVSPGCSWRHTPTGRPGSQQEPQQQFCSEVAMDRDCQGFQKPQRSGVRVQEGRVGIGILYPHETLTLARGQGVCQGYVQGGNSSILQYF